MAWSRLIHYVAYAAILGTGSAIPVPTSSADTCPSVLSKAGVTKDFYMSVAHVCHSMTVRDLKKFDPSATENNYVPTVARDLQSEQAILPYAPDFKGKDDDMFVTEGLKTIDMVLSYSDKKRWDIADFTPLKLIIHAFHMQEVWSYVLVEYKKFGTAAVPAPTEQFCQCALDLDNNGIMRGLRLIAMATREPGLYYGDQSFTDRKVAFVGRPLAETGYNWLEYRSDLGKQGAEVKRARALFTEDLSVDPHTMSNAVMWDVWKRGGFPNAKKAIKVPTAQHRDAALFLYCAIQKAHKEH